MVASPGNGHCGDDDLLHSLYVVCVCLSAIGFQWHFFVFLSFHGLLWCIICMPFIASDSWWQCMAIKWCSFLMSLFSPFVCSGVCVFGFFENGLVYRLWVCELMKWQIRLTPMGASGHTAGRTDWWRANVLMAIICVCEGLTHLSPSPVGCVYSRNVRMAPGYRPSLSRRRKGARP